jgi:hypothetical protein
MVFCFLKLKKKIEIILIEKKLRYNLLKSVINFNFN